MANIPLKSIKFPDLPDTYIINPTIAEVDGLQDALDEKADKTDVYNGFVSETLQGSIASFDDGADDIPVKSLVAEIVPIQSGSGDPSPDNIRLITGWTEAEIHVADGENPHIVDNVTTINWQSQAGTVYGGSIDVTSGVLTVDRAMVDMGTLTFGTATASGRSSASLGAKPPTSGDDTSGLVCSAFKAITVQKWYDSDDDGVTICGSGYGGNGNVGICHLAYANYTSAQLASALSGVILVYPLATPQTYQLTSTEVKTLLGNNNIWADTGDIDLTYRADLGLYLDKIINA